MCRVSQVRHFKVHVGPCHLEVDRKKTNAKGCPSTRPMGLNKSNAKCDIIYMVNPPAIGWFLRPSAGESEFLGVSFGYATQYFYEHNSATLDLMLSRPTAGRTRTSHLMLRCHIDVLRLDLGQSQGPWTPRCGFKQDLSKH